MNMLVLADRIINTAHVALVDRQGSGLVLHLAVPVPSGRGGLGGWLRGRPAGQDHLTVMVTDPEEVALIWDALTVPMDI
jgi:hypothetical protein